MANETHPAEVPQRVQYDVSSSAHYKGYSHCKLSSREETSKQFISEAFYKCCQLVFFSGRVENKVQISIK